MDSQKSELNDHQMWYAARIIIKCVVNENYNDNVLFDEQINLIQALSAEQAYEKALAIEKNSETEYLNSENEPVKWIFEGLYDLEEISDELYDQLKVSSKRFRSKNSHALTVPKERLSVSWGRNDDDRIANDILNDN